MERLARIPCQQVGRNVPVCAGPAHSNQSSDVGATPTVLSVWDNNQLADKALGHEISLRLVELRQAIYTADKRLDLAFLDVTNDTAEIAAGSLRRTVQCEVLQIHGPQIKLHNRSGNRASRRVTALGAQDPQQVVENRTANEIGHHIDRLAASGCIDGSNKIIAFRG